MAPIRAISIHLRPSNYLAILAKSSAPEADAAKAKLLQDHMPLLLRIVMHFAPNEEYWEDALQAARLGFLMALHRFDPGRGTTIGAFAPKFILGEVGQILRSGESNVGWDHSEIDQDQDLLLEEEPSCRADGTLERNDIEAEALDDRSLENLYDRTKAHRAVCAFVASLSSCDQYLLIRVFWQGTSPAEMARELGVSRQAIGQRLQRIYRRGRQSLTHLNDLTVVA